MNLAEALLRRLRRAPREPAEAERPASVAEAPDHEAAVAALTAPGAPFELATEEVDGAPMRMFVNRPRHLGQLLDAAAAYGDAACVICGDERLSYTEFVARAKACAGGLRSLCGVAPGDRVAILAANRPEWMLAMWGALYLGAVVVAVNGWWTRRETLDALAEVGPKVLIADAKRLAALRGDDDVAPPVPVVSMDAGDARDGALPFTSLLAAEPLAAPAPVEEGDAAAVMFTSGTTGRPSGVVISHRAWIAGLMNAKAAAAILFARHPSLAAVDADVRVLASLPFFHVGGGHGIVLGAVAGGATVIIPPERFDARATLELIERERATRWSAVPAMVRRVCLDPAAKAHDLSAMRSVGYGAAPSGGELQALVYETFPNARAVSNAYGLTEAGSVFAMNTGPDLKARPDSVGRPFLTAEIRIVDDAGRPLPAGALGEVQVRGPFLMTGLWGGGGDDAFAPSPFASGRWLRTGDVGRLDEGGFLYLVDRKKDIIIRGGENVFAGEVERRIEAHPDVLEAAVVAAPSADLGEEVRAVVRLREGRALDADALRAWVGATLAPFKTPRYVEFRDAPLPRNAAGKVLKAVLKAEPLAGSR